MKTDKQGCSTCPNGQENYYNVTALSGKVFLYYCFRTENGVFFSTTTTDLETAILKRDNWLKQRELK